MTDVTGVRDIFHNRIILQFILIPTIMQLNKSARCVGGYHGLRGAGYGYGSSKSNGNAVVQTFAWASYFSPALYARPDGGYYWNAQDILAVSHEVAEWADDPFILGATLSWTT